jgi:hypothetical protein
MTVYEIIKFLSNNMDKIIKDGMTIIDVIEDVNKHPHYESRKVFSLYYDEKKKELMSVLSLSGSPTAWNHYEMPIVSYEDLAEEIQERIEEAKESEKLEQNDVMYIEVEAS